MISFPSSYSPLISFPLFSILLIFSFHSTLLIRTGLFSATQTKELKELARAGLRNPVSVTVQVTKKAQNPSSSSAENNDSEKKGKLMQQATPSSLENFFMICPYDERPLQLSLFIMKNLKSKIIVFCSTCACVDYYTEIFSKMTRTPVTAKAVVGVTDKSEGGDESKGEGVEGMHIEKEGSATATGNKNQNNKNNNNSSSSSSSSSSGGSKVVKSSHLPSCINTTGFHGKMVPKKRTMLYKKFLALPYGVLFCTDIAARGIDFPDIDFIVQLSAPKG